MEMRLGPRKVDKPLILYGKGRLGLLAAEIFAELKIPVHRVIDRDDAYRLTWLEQRYLVAVCVATTPFTSILGELTFKGFEDVVPVWDIIEAYPEIGIRNGWFIGPLSSLDTRGVNAVWLGLTDEKSERAYSDFFSWRSGGGGTEPIISDSQISYSRAYHRLPSTLADIRKRQRILTFEESQFVRSPDIPVEVYIHVEGYELRVIEENMPALFINNRPTIEVACYHSRDGLWKIQKILMDNLSNYDFYFNVYAYQGQAAYFTCKPR